MPRAAPLPLLLLAACAAPAVAPRAAPPPAELPKPAPAPADAEAAHREYTAGLACACEQGKHARSLDEAKASVEQCRAHFVHCRALPECERAAATESRLLAMRRCGGDAAADGVAVYEAWAREGAHANGRAMRVGTQTLAVDGAPLFAADSIAELRDLAHADRCTPETASLPITWGVRVVLRPEAARRVASSTPPPGDALDDACRDGPCLVLVRGDAALGFLNAGGWTFDGPLDFDGVELDAVCRPIATPR